MTKKQLTPKIDKTSGQAAQRRKLSVLTRASLALALLAVAAAAGMRVGATPNSRGGVFSFFSSSAGTVLSAASMSPKIAAVGMTPLNNTITGPCPGAGCSAVYTVTVFRGTSGGSGGDFTAELETIAPLPQGVSAVFASNTLFFLASETQKSTTVTYTADATAINGVYGVHVRATVDGDPADFAESVNNTLTITGVCDVPVVLTNPTNQTIVYGTDATFTAAHTGTSPTPSTQWERSTDGGGTWLPIPLATSSSYTVVHPTVGMTGYQYRAHYQAPCGEAFTTGATLTVTPKPVTASVTALDKVYDGTDAATIDSCTVNSLEPGDTVTCNANGPNTFNDKHVGNGKTVTARDIVLGGPDAANYILMDPLPPPPPGTRYVATTGSDAANDCLTPGSPCATIAYSITQANPGETIIVAAGTYPENVTVNKSLTLRGAQAGVDARGRTASESIIAPASGAALTLVTGSAGATIDGFTMSGGSRGIESGSGPLHLLQILNNRVVAFTGNGIFLNDPGNDITVNQNVIDGGSKVGSGGLFHLDTDTFNGFYLTNNNIVGRGATDGSTGFFVDGNHNVSISATPRAPLISGNLIDSCNTGMNLGTRAFGSLTLPNAGTISNNAFSNNNFDGLQGGIQHVVVSGNNFTANGRHGIALTSFGNMGADRGAQNSSVTQNCFTGNGFAQAGSAIFFSSTQAAGTISTNSANQNNIAGNNIGASYAGSETIGAENNFWGSSTGPTHTGNPGGVGDAVATPGSGTIDYVPFLASAVACPPPPSGPSYNATTTADITPRPITVTVDPGQGKTYGSPDPPLTYSVTSGSLAPGDSFVGGLIRAVGENVGSYAINQGTLAISDGNNGFNYTFTFVGDNFVISQAAPSCTVNGYNVTYDAAAHTATGQCLGVFGETLAGLDLSQTTHTNAGDYQDDPWTFTDGTGNYSGTSGTVDDFIGKADANCSITPYNVIYDGNSHTAMGQCLGVVGETLAGLVLSGTTHTGAGFYPGDPWTFTDITGNYNNTGGTVDDNIDKAPSSTTVNCGGITEFIGNSYEYTGSPIEPCTYTVTGVGLTGGDFTIGPFPVPSANYLNNRNVGTATAFYNYPGDDNHLPSTDSDTFSITPRPITVTADPGQSKVYGDPDPVFTYSVTSGSLGTGDSFTGFQGRAPGENVGSYAINQGTLAISDTNGGNNYTLTYVSNNFAITQRTITVTADPGQTKVYGNADPALFTYSVTSGNLAFTDSFTGSLVRVAGENVGSYQINQGSLAISDGNGGANYQLTYVPDDFTITERPITVTADPGQAKIFGMSDPLPFTYTVTSGNLAGTDSFTGVLDRVAGEAVGTYPITIGTLDISDGNNGDNYDLTFVSNDFTINPCPVVSTSNQTVLTDTIVHIPVSTTTTNGGLIIGADFWLNYDPAVLSPLPADITATLGTVPPPGTMMTLGTATPGIVKVSFVVPGGYFAGAGTLATLHMKTIGPIGSSTGLTLSNVKYNNGLVCSSSTSGILNIISGTIAGKVEYENSIPGPLRPVPGTTLTGVGGTPTVVGATDFSGNYSMSGFGNGAYTVTPTHTATTCFDAPNGILSDDAAIIAQYVVGLVPLNSVQLRAADVAGLGPGNISSYEAALIARFLVCLPTAGSQVGQWKFVPVNRAYANVHADHPNDNYLALLMGDVTGDWAPPTAGPMMAGLQLLDSPVRESVTVSLPSMSAQAGSTLSVPLQVANLRQAGVTSYQFDVRYDPAVVEPADVAVELAGTLSQGMNFAANAPEPGLLKVTVYGVMPVYGDGIYVNLRLNTLAAGASPLTITSFILNNGQAQVFAQHGKINVAGSPVLSISGRLLTANGSPVPDARVTVAEAFATSTRGLTVVSNAEGRFFVNNLVTGRTYTLTVSSRDHKFTPVTVAVTGDVTELDMIAEP